MRGGDRFASQIIMFLQYFRNIFAIILSLLYLFCLYLPFDGLQIIDNDSIEDYVGYDYYY